HEVDDVIAIALHLEERMVSLAEHSLDQDKAFIFLVEFGMAPLLELDDHVRIAPGAPVDARQHHVGTLTGQRKLVFDKHLDVAETGVHEVMGQYRDTAPPGLPL